VADAEECRGVADTTLSAVADQLAFLEGEQITEEGRTLSVGVNMDRRLSEDISVATDGRGIRPSQTQVQDMRLAAVDAILLAAGLEVA